MQTIENINTLIIGEGGREHALLWKIQQSKIKGKIFVAPGNDGMLQSAIKADIDIDNHYELVQFCKEKNIYLCVIGPEAPIEKGIADYLRKNNINVFAPNKAAAKLETSKLFTKNLCKKHNIPTAKFYHTDQYKEAERIFEKQKFPLVIKADGIAAGKGVIIAENKIQAIKAFDKLSKISKNIIIEEFIDGVEASFFIITDGNTILNFASAKDYKKSLEKDQGPNTGGMGAISPSPDFTEEIQQKTIENIVEPTIKALKQQNIIYQGVLYVGLIIKEQKPYLLEYNARFGDPECQAILCRYKGDLLELFYKTAIGKLHEFNNGQDLWKNEHCVTIVMVNQEYPEKIKASIKDRIITKIENAKKIKGAKLFHAGTKYQDSKLIAKGGRVISCCGTHKNINKAVKIALKAARAIKWENSRFRNDIGSLKIKRQKSKKHEMQAKQIQAKPPSENFKNSTMIKVDTKHDRQVKPPSENLMDPTMVKVDTSYSKASIAPPLLYSIWNKLKKSKMCRYLMSKLNIKKNKFQKK